MRNAGGSIRDVSFATQRAHWPDKKENFDMLISLKEILKIAEEKKIAIGAFNASGLEAIEAELAAAEELNLPVIIQFAQCHEPWIPLKTIGPIMVEMAKKAKVPVCVHLDHGETLEYLREALEIGFTGIMYDAYFNKKNCKPKEVI